MVNSFEMGGSEHQMVEVASRQKQRGYRVVVGCLSSKGPLREILRSAGVSVVEFNPKGSLFRLGGLLQFMRLTAFFARHRFDIFQAHDLYSTLLGVPSAWLGRVPVILSCRRDLSHWWWYTPNRRKILRHIQERSTFVIVNSKAVCDFLVEREDFDPNLIRIIRNGVDLDRFTALRSHRPILFPHWGAESRLVAVVANMHVEAKGHTDLIHAAEEVSRNFTAVKFLLVGDGVRRANLEAMTIELGLSQTVLFLGHRNDVPSILASCDIFVLPSWSEGLPNSVLEAMAAGLPIVATRVGGVPEIIEDGLSGLLVTPKDPHALATAILKLLTNKQFAEQLGRCAKDRVWAGFSLERLLAELDGLYGEARSRG
jgi:L-malate glycosyltransferase